MAKFMDGHIASIREDIVGDIEVLVTVAHNFSKFIKENKAGSVFEAKEIEKVAERVSEYIATYKLEENHD